MAKKKKLIPIYKSVVYATREIVDHLMDHMHSMSTKLNLSPEEIAKISGEVYGFKTEQDLKVLVGMYYHWLKKQENKDTNNG
jgi:hypothetical protein